MIKKNKILLKNTSFTFKYTAGIIVSKQKYKFGYFEIRFKLPKDGKGMWPAFWTYGGNKNDEIDFFEIKCERNNYVHVDVHCPDGCSNYPAFMWTHKDWGGWIKTKGFLDDGYNTIAGEWQNGYIKWYLNGKGIAYFKSNFETAMYIIANMSMAKDGGAFDPGPDESTKYPGIMQVDYIRVWTNEKPQNFISPYSTSEYQSMKASSSELAGNNSTLGRKKRFLYGDKDQYKNDGIFLSLLRDSKTSFQLTLQGNNGREISVEILDKSGKSVFTKDKHTAEFLQINMSNLPFGKYIFKAIYDGKTVQQEIEY